MPESNLEEPTIADLDLPEFARQLRSRNADILTEDEQLALDAARVLVAGTGTVGGSVVEPLVRMGVADLTLADPDVYDVTNLNRQACYVADVGRPKPVVLAERAAAVNPMCATTVMEDGITPDNVEAALDRVTVVFESVDGSMDLWAKYLVHHHAALRGIPVISGLDYGGKPTLYVFDYRRDPRPFFGKGSEADHRAGRIADAVKWLGRRPLPTDFIGVIEDRVRTGAPWPQVAYTALGMGALGSRAILDLILGRPVPHIVAVDIHQLVRPRSQRVAQRLRWPIAILRVARAAYRLRRDGPAEYEEPVAEHTALPARVAPVAEAIRRAPSAWNLQPWTIAATGSGELSLSTAPRAELPAADPERRWMLQGIGCAIEAASTVARIDCALTLDDGAVGERVATLRVDRLEPAHTRALGMLRRRRTDRRRFGRDAPRAELLDGLARVAEEAGAGVATVVERDDIALLARNAREAIERQLAGEGVLGDVLANIGHSDPRAHTGYGVGVAWPDGADGMRLRARARMGWPVSARGGGARALARWHERRIRHSGAVVAIPSGTTPVEWLASGRLLLRLWLLAVQEGLAGHPISLDPAPDASWEPLPRLGLEASPDEGVTLLRLGRSTEAPLTARIPIDDLMAG